MLMLLGLNLYAQYICVKRKETAGGMILQALFSPRGTLETHNQSKNEKPDTFLYRSRRFTCIGPV